MKGVCGGGGWWRVFLDGAVKRWRTRPVRIRRQPAELLVVGTNPPSRTRVYSLKKGGYYTPYFLLLSKVLSMYASPSGGHFHIFEEHDTLESLVIKLNKLFGY